MVTFVGSTRRGLPTPAPPASASLSCVPDGFADSVMTTASSGPPASGAPSTPSITCGNVNGVTWLVRRRLVGFHQLLVKPVMGQVDTVQVLLIAERDGKRHDGAYALELALHQIGSGIGDDMDTRRVDAGGCLLQNTPIVLRIA